MNLFKCNIDYNNGVRQPVEKNTVSDNSRWKKLDDIAYNQEWERMCDLDVKGRSMALAIKNVLDDQNKNNGLTYEEFTRLVMGCGCCKRHSVGVLFKQQHVKQYDTTKPTTFTNENKPCDCRCRFWSRQMATVREYQ
jgi:hypothetical protein